MVEDQIYKTEYERLACYEADFRTQKTYEELMILIDANYGTEKRNVGNFILHLNSCLTHINDGMLPRLLRYDETQAVYFDSYIGNSEIAELEKRNLDDLRNMLNQSTNIPKDIKTHFTTQNGVDIRTTNIHTAMVAFRRYYNRICELMRDNVCVSRGDALSEAERCQLRTYLRYVFELTTL